MDKGTHKTYLICEFDGRKRKLRQKWNNDKCQSVKVSI